MQEKSVLRTRWCVVLKFLKLTAFAIDANLFSTTHCRTRVLVPVCHTDKNKKPLYAAYIFGGRTGTRTLDPLIKGPVIWQIRHIINCA